MKFYLKASLANAMTIDWIATATIIAIAIEIAIRTVFTACTTPFATEKRKKIYQAKNLQISQIFYSFPSKPAWHLHEPLI